MAASSLRILIVKLSSLGDVVHALPVVADILASRPEASIDWVVEPAFAPLLSRVAGIAEVIELPLRRWRRNGWWHRSTRSGFRAFLKRLRHTRYDAVIDLQGLSKSALVAWLARGPSYGLANRSEGSSHEWPARWLATRPIRVEPKSHALDRSRQLVAQALGTATDMPPSFGLRPAQPASQDRDAQADADRVVFVHGSSRDDKLWPEANWIELAQRIVAAGGTVALPHADATERSRAERIAETVAPDAGTRAGTGTGSKANAGCEVWPAMDMAALIDRMAATAGVIGVDSGPSHVAVALDLPHVQIYNHPTAWRTGPQRRHGHAHQVSIEALPTPTVDAVWNAWQQVRVERRRAP